MRVLHIITGLGTGGAEIMLCKLLGSSAFAHVQHAVISLRDRGALGTRIEALGIPLYCLGLTSFWRLPLALWRLFRWVREFRPTLIQGWMYHGNLCASLAGRIAGSPTPVLWNVRQSLGTLSSEKPLTNFVIRLGARWSSGVGAILYNSQTAARQHEALGYDKRKTVVIPNGFDTNQFKPDADCRKAIGRQLAIEDEACLVGLIARFHPMKDHQNFLRAAALVAQSHPNARFVLVGKDVDSQNPSLQSLIQALGLQRAVHMLGERHDVPCITAALDVAVNSSWRGEAFPNAIGEAMACGVPCVVTDVGDSAMIVGETGLCVPPRDTESLARALSNLIDADASARHELGIAARNRIVSLYSLDQVAQQYVETYGRYNDGGTQ